MFKLKQTPKPEKPVKPRVNILSLLRHRSQPQTRRELEIANNKKIVEAMKGAM